MTSGPAKSTAGPEKSTAVTEKSTTVTEKSKAVAEKSTAVAEKSTAVAEKSTAVLEKSAVVSVKDKKLVKEIEDYAGKDREIWKYEQYRYSYLPLWTLHLFFMICCVVKIIFRSSIDLK